MVIKEFGEPSTVVYTNSNSRRNRAENAGFEVVRRLGHRNLSGLPDLCDPNDLLTLLSEKADAEQGRFNGGVSVVSDTELFKTDPEGNARGLFPIHAQAEEIVNAYAELMENGGNLIAATGVFAVSNLVSQSSVEVQPLDVRDDLRREELFRILIGDGDPQDTVHLTLQNGHGQLIKTEDNDWPKMRRSLAIFDGITEEQIKMMRDIEGRRYGLGVWDLFEVPQELVDVLKQESLPKFFKQVEQWDDERLTKKPLNKLDSMEKALDAIDYSNREAVELVIESKKKFATDEERESVLKKELMDVLIFWLQSGNYATAYDDQKQPMDVLKNEKGELVGLDISSLGDWKDIVNYCGSAEEAIWLTVSRSIQKLGYVKQWPERVDPTFQASMQQTVELIFRYSIASGWDIIRDMEETLDKNRWNYPQYLFTPELTPILDNAKASTFVRFLRKANIEVEGREINLLSLYHRSFPSDYHQGAKENMSKDKLKEKLELWTRVCLDVAARYSTNPRYKGHAEGMIAELFG